MDEAVGLVKELLHVPETHEVIFLQGGASLQFAMVAFNFLSESGSAEYLDTGAWAFKAHKEAAGLGNATIVASSNEKNYNFIPKGYAITFFSASESAPLSSQSSMALLSVVFWKFLATIYVLYRGFFL